MITVTKRISTNTRLLKDHLTKYKNTFYALCELINNSLQAGANKIEINFDYSTEVSKSPINEIIIRDNGYGVSWSEFDNKILEIATEVKSGGKGVGRFGAFQIGRSMTIDTAAFDIKNNKFSEIHFPLNAHEIGTSKFENLDLKIDYVLHAKKVEPYYQVTISNFYHGSAEKINFRNKLTEEFLENNIRQAIFEKYPLEIFNKGIKFLVDGKVIEKNEFVIGTPSLINQVFKDKKGNDHEMSFQFYNIHSSLNKVKVFFTIDNAGLKTVAHEFTFSSDWYTPDLGTWFIYVNSDIFSSDLFRNLDLETLGEEEIKNLKDFVRETINNFFKAKNKRFEKFLNTLEKDSAYPYLENKPASKTQELIFKKVAYLIEDDHKLIKNQEKIRGLFYELLDKAIRNGYVEDIFQKVLDLKDETLIKFHGLLQRTELEDVINFSAQVAEKLEFLDFLHELIYGDLSKVLKERSQLHKIIENQLWLFGENYNGSPNLWSDKKLGNILSELNEKHLHYEPTAKDENLIKNEVEGLDNITDLFFLNEKVLDDERREIMVVELKSPKCSISGKELEQIDKYAYTIETYPGLPSDKVKYKLVLISSHLTGFANSKMDSAKTKFNKPFLYDLKTKKDIEIYVMEWSELIELNKRRLGYLSKQLKVKDKSVKVKFETEYSALIDQKVSSRLVKIT